MIITHQLVDLTIALAIGMVVGSRKGRRIGVISGSRHAKYIVDHLHENTVDAKSFVSAIHPEVVVITSEEDLLQYEPSPIYRASLTKALNSIEHNLFYVPSSRRSPAAIITSAMVNSDLLGHELGHHRDHIRSTKRIFDSTMSQERAAWDMSPCSGGTCEMQENALLSYKKACIGTTAGAILGILTSILILQCKYDI